MNKEKYSIDGGCAQSRYISPAVKVIELSFRNAILFESNTGSTTGEDGTPKTPVW